MNILIPALICILLVIFKSILLTILTNEDGNGVTGVYVLMGINSVLLLSVMYILFSSL